MTPAFTNIMAKIVASAFNTGREKKAATTSRVSPPTKVAITSTLEHGISPGRKIEQEKLFNQLT